MYIYSTYKSTNNKEIKEYKEDLKKISSIKLRRSSKFDIMSVYTSLKCLENQNYTKDLSLYISSEYACTNEAIKVLKQVNKDNDFVMPFDFLNINTNNVGFHISQALNTTGKSINISSENISFEKALEIAYYDLIFNQREDCLITACDEIIDDSLIKEKNSSQKETSISFYLKNNNCDKQAISFIKDILSFPNIEQLNDFLLDLKYDNISLNNYAKESLDHLKIDKNLVNSNDISLNEYAQESIINLIKEKGLSIHISLDSKKKAILLIFDKQ